jgi:hypothetical protein
MTADDESHLRTLSILHYVFGGLLLLGGLFCLIYMGIGVAMIASGGSRSDTMVGGVVLLVIGLVIGAFIGVKAALLIWAGACLGARQRPLLCTIAAAISCMNFPLGTALGVFTLIVLNRPAVKAAFARNC